MQKTSLFLFTFSIILFSACNEPVKKSTVKLRQHKSPVTSGFYFANAKQWLSANDSAITNKKIVFAVNRTDAENFRGIDTVIIPKDFTGDVESYLPFPFSVPAIKQINKVIFFSYPAQAFAAYENGELVYAGPVNMGRKNDPTPTGLFFTNWKAKKTTSTFNDEWELKWNFNIVNKEGVGWHQYSLPGYPASHSCLRLQENDARNLYEWADQWEVDKKENITLKGTAVIVFGSYNFDEPKPWLQLVANPSALTISAEQVENITAPFLNEILKWQQKRQQATI